MNRYAFALMLMFVVTMLSQVTDADDRWPQFRGQGSRGVTDETGLPTSWSQTENVAWVTDIPGLGWSSPIVWDGTVYLTTVVSATPVEEPQGGLYRGSETWLPSQSEHRWLVYAIDVESGAVKWEREVHRGAPRVGHHLKNTLASETPVTDGESVYVYFGNVGVYALNFDGTVVWERRFDAAKTRLGWGPAASPVLHDGTLFIVNDNDEESFVVALDAATGDERWRVARDEGTNWSTPYVWEHDGRTELVTTGSDLVRSYDLDGNELWTFSGMNTIAIPQPFSAHGLLYLTTGYVGDPIKPVFAIRPGASGDITLAEGERSSEFVAWYVDDAGPYHPTPLVIGDHYVTLHDRGFFTVHDAHTGVELYFTEEQIQNQEVRRRVAVGTGGFTASPWAYNGRVFMLSEEGDTYVLDAENNFRLVTTNSLDEVAMSSPAIARGSLFIRTRSNLYRLSDLSR